MPIERTKQRSRDLADAHVHHDLDQVRAILAPDLVWHISGMAAAFGRENYVEGLEMGRAAFSALRIEIERTVAEADLVVAHWHVRGRHTGTFQGIAPTNREIDYRVLWMYRFVGEQVAEAWLFPEDFMAQLR